MTTRTPIKTDLSKTEQAEKFGNFVFSTIRTQVGADDHPSPMLKSMIHDLNADPNVVELVQDATLLAVDMGELILEAAVKGTPTGLVMMQIGGLLGLEMPELIADIDSVRE